ncbi:aspartate beta-hydroxylase domain-containing protein 2 [Amia ocellicauda]|uniref:aspartate beta-hydroxylase domain-containing protein 2 n=1 Tax=Amia ocellicauda TaxID=2972642 RepID=UPI003463B12B
MMEWSLDGLRGLVGGGMQSVRECESGALASVGCLLLLFLWYCYRMGRDQGPTRRYPELGGAGSRGVAGGGGTGGASVKGGLALGRGSGVGLGGGQNGFAYCQSPECFRCSAPGEGLNQRLYHSLQEYAKRYTWAGMGRVHKGVREQGRYLSARPASIQRPEVFFLPDLPSAPYFSREAQKHDVELLERNYPALLAEFHSVYRPPTGASPTTPPGWKANSTPQGQWLTFYLVNQGVSVPQNCRRCPRTYRLLGSLRTFLGNNVFGNACFSLLAPGALISEHYGPTNVRLRCHLGVRVPPGCELVVGGEPQCWAEGSCLLFDDSFLHTAFHDGSAEDGPRVVFMVDLWHPNVAAAERQALDYIFSPGR